MSDAKRPDPRSAEEIAVAQRALVKILAVATGIPVLWVTFMAWGALSSMDQTPGTQGGFGWFMVIWGLLSPVVWLAANGTTYKRINAGDMDAGRVLPIVPAFWVIIWFVALLTG